MQTASSSARGRSSRGSWSAGITAELEEEADAEVAGGSRWRRGGHHRRNGDDNGYRCGHHCGGLDAAGGGGGEEGGWRCRAGDRGRAPTSAIIVAVSVVDIGHRRRRPLSWPSTNRPSSWPSPLSTSAVVDVGHRRGRRRVGHVVRAYSKKGRQESNTLMRLMR